MFPKARLDALHDGIFSVAMTLLVLDVLARSRPSWSAATDRLRRQSASMPAIFC
jgi:uncharacterized membrane protein